MAFIITFLCVLFGTLGLVLPLIVRVHEESSAPSWPFAWIDNEDEDEDEDEDEVVKC